MRRARTREADRALETESVESAAAVEPRASSLMRPQRTAGNEAAGSLLARDNEKADAQEKGTEASTTLVLPDPIGVIPIESYSLAGTNEIAVTAASSGADPRLFEAGTNGTSFAVVKLSTEYFEITLTGGRDLLRPVQQRFSLNAKSIATAVPDKAKRRVD